MKTGLEDLWNKLSLTEDEKSKVVIEKDWIEEIAEARRNCLIGKLLTKRILNLEVMRSVLHKVWKLEGGLEIKEVDDKVHVFQFQDETEKDRVLVRQPWSFNKSLIVFKEFDGLSLLDSINMEWCPFWVQIHGLPFGMMNKKIKIVIREAIREVFDVETNYEQVAWGKWLRVRVNINVQKLLKKGKLISVEGGRKMLILFKYERA